MACTIQLQRSLQNLYTCYMCNVLNQGFVVASFSDGGSGNSPATNNTGSVSNSGGNGGGNSGQGSSAGSSRLGMHEMMQRAVTAARSATSSLAGLDVEEDAPIPTLHWPPDPPGYHFQFQAH